MILLHTEQNGFPCLELGSTSKIPDLTGLGMRCENLGFPSGSVIKNPPVSAGDAGSTPVSGRSPGEGNGNPLQYACLGNSMDRETCWAIVHGVAQSQTRLRTYTQTLFLWIRAHPLLTQDVCFLAGPHSETLGSGGHNSMHVKDLQGKV